MARITTYPAITSAQGTTNLDNSDVFILDGDGGSRKITAKELATASADKLMQYTSSIPAGKSGLYRGASLGSGNTFAAASTSAQRAAIANGSFDGLFIGDYWTIGSRIYRIADFNYWKRTGDTDFNTNHIVIVPDASFGNGKMNDTNDTTGAYVGSKMYTDESSVLNTARTTVSDHFGGYLASHKIYLPNATSSGAESAGAWVASTVDLMNELMVYGQFIRTAPTDTSYLVTTEKSQLALFRLNPAMINLRYTYWLRNVASATTFAIVAYYGAAGVTGASASFGVRPAFAVKGTA